MTLDPMLTAQELADHLRRDVEWVQGQARVGNLPGIKVGRLWRFRLSAIEAWEQSQSTVDPMALSPLAAARRRSA